jgi:hypothetical protein
MGVVDISIIFHLFRLKNFEHGFRAEEGELEVGQELADKVSSQGEEVSLDH